MSDESWRGKIGGLEGDELEAFLGEAHLARLACNDTSGWPYVVPVWHEWSDDSFYVIPRKRSSWAEFLHDEPRCALTIDEDGTLRKVITQCEAECVERPNVGGAWVPIAERMSTAVPGPGRPEVPRTDARQGALAVPAGRPGADVDMAGRRLGGPLSPLDPPRSP